MLEHVSVFVCEETVEDIRLIQHSLWRVSLSVLILYFNPLYLLDYPVIYDACKYCMVHYVGIFIFHMSV